MEIIKIPSKFFPPNGRTALTFFNEGELHIISFEKIGGKFTYKEVTIYEAAHEISRGI